MPHRVIDIVLQEWKFFRDELIKKSAELDRLRKAEHLLTELHATVRGECPSLLNEGSGGNASLDLEIKTLLGRR